MLTKARLLFFALLAALASASPAAATWNVAQSAHFRVHGNESAKALTARTMLLEDYRSMLVAMTSGQPPLDDAPRLDVFLLESLADARPFEKIAPGVAGFYSASIGRIGAFADTTTLSQTILLHEYAHHFMLSSSAAAYPAWYIEGFAEYFSTAVFKPDRIEFGGVSAPRASWLGNGTWLPLHRLLARDISRRRSDETAMYYAQSWLLTHYLFRMPGMTPKLTAYLRSVSKGGDPVEAFKTEIDPDLRGFERKLRAYMTGRAFTYSVRQRTPPVAASVTVNALGPAAEAMLMQQVALEYGVKPAGREAAAAAVRKAAARFGDDPLAQRTLALLELRYGDRAAAIAQLDALLVRNPDDSTLLRWRAAAIFGAGRMTAADRTAARKLLVRAFNADPQDWRTLFAYVRLNDLTAGPLEKSVMDVLLRTYELAPQVGEVVVATAIAIAQTGDIQAAARILEPLANAAHGSGDDPDDDRTVSLAKALRERALAGDRTGMIALVRAPAADAK